MKISKNCKSVTAKGSITSNTKYEEGVQYIRSAIDALGSVAKDDVVAKEAIANLGVVLLDLQ